MSDALRPVGQKHPLRGVFRARLGGFTSSHQNEILSRSISFLFYINIITSCAGGFEQPVSDALRPVGQKHPCGVFLGRGLAGSPAPSKTRYFLRSISFLFYINFYNKLRWWIRTARVRRFASCRTKTPLWGVSLSKSPFSGNNVGRVSISALRAAAVRRLRSETRLRAR